MRAKSRRRVGRPLPRIKTQKQGKKTLFPRSLPERMFCLLHRTKIKPAHKLTSPARRPLPKKAFKKNEQILNILHPMKNLKKTSTSPNYLTYKQRYNEVKLPHPIKPPKTNNNRPDVHGSGIMVHVLSSIPHFRSL